MKAFNPFEYRPRHGGRFCDTSTPASVSDEWGLAERLYGHAIGIVATTYLRVFHQLHVYGAEHLPRRGPFVMVSNHASHLDSVILSSALPRQNRLHLLPMAVSDTFCVRPLSPRSSMMALNALPLWRRHPGRHAHSDLRDRLQSGDVIMAAYPEGTRSRDGKMGTFRTGIGMLVSDTAVPIVPCKISGAFAAFPPEKNVPRPGPISLHIGAPMDFSTFANDEPGWQRTARRIQAAVYALGPREDLESQD